MNPFRFLKVLICSVVIVTSLTGSAFADHRRGGGTSFRFSYGGFGYGYPSYGFGYGSYPYRYGGYRGYGYGGSGIGLQIYSPPNYYYSTPSYVYPSYVAPTYTTPSPVIVNPPPSIPAPAFDNGPIVIMAPAANDKPVEYQLNGQSFSIKPGQSQKFNHDRDWIVEFNRGDGKGSGKYSLKATTYKFKMTDNGWELFEAAKPEPPTDDIQPPEEAVKPKAIPKAPAPAPAEGDAK